MIRTIFIAFAAILVALGNHRAAAQGTFGMLPEPITSHELNGYADRLKLSPQQRQAVQALHDQYKVEFRALRDGEITGFMKEMRDLNGGGMMPKRDAVESFLKKMDAINTKIAALDSQIFDQLLPLLTEEQTAMLSRVRQARQRARYNAQQMMMMSGDRGVDLSELFMALDLNAEQRQNADATLAPYEAKLTSSLGKLHEATSKMILNLYDTLAKQGFTEASMNDPETAQKMGEAMQVAWKESTKKMMEMAHDISDLNRRTYRSLAAGIPAESARQFRNEYYKKAYPEAAFVFMGDDKPFVAAFKLAEITDEQRTAVSAARDEFNGKMDRLIEETANALDRSHKENSPFDYDAEKMAEQQKKLTELQTKAQETVNTIDTSLSAILGPELTRKVGVNSPRAVNDDMMPQVKAALEAQAAELKARGAADDAEVGSEQNMAQTMEWGGDQFLPGRINQRDLIEYAARLKLTNDQRTTAVQLLKNYHEAFQHVTETEVAAVNKANQSLWTVDPTTQTSKPPKAQAIDEVYKLRKAALQAIRAADNSFFDDLDAAVLTKEQSSLIKRVRLARQRQCCSGSNPSMYGYGMGSNESGIDLSTLVQRLRLDDATLKAVDPDLAAYEESVTALMVTKREFDLELQQAQERWQVAAQQVQAEGNPMAHSQKMQEIMGEASKKSTQAGAEVAKLNRETLEKLLAKLPTEPAFTLRNDFNRQAYPNIYNDGTSVERQLRDALKLSDLTDDQRRQLNDLSAEYHPAYSAFCEQMVSMSAGAATPSFMTGFDADDWKKYQERHENMSKINFDRSELNMRTIGKMKSTLTEDQIHRLGGLPEPQKDNEFQMW